jgi:hypothetical protein
MGASNDSSQLFCGVCLHASMSKVQRSNVLIAPKSLAQQNIIPAWERESPRRACSVEVCAVC